jgi:hypothetical protein
MTSVGRSTEPRGAEQVAPENAAEGRDLLHVLIMFILQETHTIGGSPERADAPDRAANKKAPLM